MKLYAKAYSSIANAHWAMFEKLYGEDSDEPYPGDADQGSGGRGPGDDRRETLPETAGADQIQMMHELGAAQ